MHQHASHWKRSHGHYSLHPSSVLQCFKWSRRSSVSAICQSDYHRDSRMTVALFLGFLGVMLSELLWRLHIASMVFMTHHSVKISQAESIANVISASWVDGST